MRMWLVDPQLMCSQHLLGEHVELHMLVGSLNRRKNIGGFLRDGLVELRSIRRRHAELVAEMLRRGFRHQSPLPDFRARRAGEVDRIANLKELARRCVDCRARIALSARTLHRRGAEAQSNRPTKIRMPGLLRASASPR